MGWFCFGRHLCEQSANVCGWPECCFGARTVKTLAAPRWVSFIAITVPVAFAGCATSVSSTLLRESPHPLAPRSPQSVEIFASGPPARPHVDLAVLQADNDSGSGGNDTGSLIA